MLGGITVKYDYYYVGSGSDLDVLKAYVNAMPNSVGHPSIVYGVGNTQFVFIGYKANASYAAFLLIGYNGCKKAILYDGIWTTTDL